MRCWPTASNLTHINCSQSALSQKPFNNRIRTFLYQSLLRRLHNILICRCQSSKNDLLYTSTRVFLVQNSGNTLFVKKPIDVKKTFLCFFILVAFFMFFNVFLFSKRFFYLKKTLAKFRAANRLARSTFKITATKFNGFIKQNTISSN